jgi:benzoyl-CoA-dihydrodiol lyase
MNAMTEPLLFKQGRGARAGALCHASRRATATGQLSVEGDVARLKLDIDEDGGIKPGYKLKLNSTTWASTSNCTTRSTASASSIPA